MQVILYIKTNTLQRYSFVKHIYRIDFNNANVLEVCTVQLCYLGK